MTGPGEAPLDVLRRLRADGLLAERYQDVAPLVARLAAAGDASALRRAGRLLAQLDRDAVLAAAPGTTTAVVALTGHSTVEGVTAPLFAEFARHHMLVEVRPGEFDSYLRDLRDPSGHLHAPDVDLALCLLDPHTVLDELPSPWQVADLAAATAHKLTELRRHVSEFTRRSQAALVLNTVPLPRAVTHALVDLRSRAEAGIVWREFNAGLLRLALDEPGTHVVDLEPLVAEGGPLNDPRMSAYARQHLGDDVLARYAREVAHLARMRRGRTKKVLVVDADNTLWDGVLGDDGPDGVTMATTFRGEAFAGFQRLLRQLGSQGVLLAVSSKNDHDPLIEVLREHPDMLLRERDFTRIHANWLPKEANLREMAAGLGLGTDGFVFADDSPSECGAVADGLPEVAVVRLDDEPALHAERLLADGWFDTPSLTAEDRARGELYRAEAERAAFQTHTVDENAYLEGLGVWVRLEPATARDALRIAQLSLRTNQFNLTARRRSATEVAAMADDDEHLVLTVRSGDRFGESGLVGALLTRRDEDGLHVLDMLLSCRVFGRGIEQTAAAAVLAHARALGLPAVHASYRPTVRNGRVRDFWPSTGFLPARTAGDELHFRHDLRELPAVPAHVRLDSPLEGLPA
ncbi:HAD-IIIC family phosphatase [Streptomyces sp. DSM 42041]|uniref:HAD-IIIC family phosphatase n=1 Tax=Streptomyces hazeniae TaxID=3075538 RepID=A0ABU2NR12_9ACTN|nr:HAD-IIIC family phosphatase [Streptomyces sp. DSM 42041]MDT0378452.1 HAD-IIIC family phosphatase [Streptomyces sp. DSM 42041]